MSSLTSVYMVTGYILESMLGRCKHRKTRAWTYQWTHQCSPSGVLVVTIWAWWCSWALSPWTSCSALCSGRRWFITNNVGFISCMSNVINSLCNKTIPILLRLGISEGILGSSWTIRRIRESFGRGHTLHTSSQLRKGIGGNLNRAVSLAMKMNLSKIWNIKHRVQVYTCMS